MLQLKHAMAHMWCLKRSCTRSKSERLNYLVDFSLSRLDHTIGAFAARAGWMDANATCLAPNFTFLSRKRPIFKPPTSLFAQLKIPYP